MSVTNRLKDDLNRLVNRQGKSTTLPDRPIAERILTSRGEGAIKPVTARAISPVQFTEVITVYSSIILTENGAFEKPTGWPTSSDITGLNVDDAYYEQRRVHASYYLTDTGVLIGYEYLVALETPLVGTVINKVSEVPSIVALNVYSKTMPTGNGLIMAKLSELGL